jgi:hypothetical protein
MGGLPGRPVPRSTHRKVRAASGVDTSRGRGGGMDTHCSAAREATFRNEGLLRCPAETMRPPPFHFPPVGLDAAAPVAAHVRAAGPRNAGLAQLPHLCAPRPRHAPRQRVMVSYKASRARPKTFLRLRLLCTTPARVATNWTWLSVR